MPFILCTTCGKEISLDFSACPYSGEVACPQCNSVMEVVVSGGVDGSVVKSKYPDPQQDLLGLCIDVINRMVVDGKN